MKIFAKAIVYSRMIKFSHTVFALPFALSAVVLVHRISPIDVGTAFWILMAMVGARSAAMGFNRLVDACIDAKNPRTASRAIPAGTISRSEAGAFIISSSLLFVLSAAMLSPLCLWLSFPVLTVMFFYSYTKRFTWLNHVVLGFAIGMAPMAVWVAATGTLSGNIVVLSIALVTHIAGFDILYACQDAEFDRKEGLYSIPSRFGIAPAMHVSELLHGISVISLLALYWLFSLSPAYLVFVGIIGVLFYFEHTLVNPHDLSKIDMAFFHVNSIISVLVFVAVLSGEVLRGII